MYIKTVAGSWLIRVYYVTLEGDFFAYETTAPANTLHLPGSLFLSQGAGSGFSASVTACGHRGETAARTHAVAMARIYKTDGDYADRVPVTLDSRHRRLVSYPAPSDLAGAAPVRLSDGFLLDRRGVSGNTAFTRWTYREYAAMESAPSPAEIMEAIIPGARVTEIYQMPFPAGTPDAAARCDSLIAAGLPDCRLVFSLPQRDRGS